VRARVCVTTPPPPPPPQQQQVPHSQSQYHNQRAGMSKASQSSWRRPGSACRGPTAMCTMWAAALRDSWGEVSCLAAPSSLAIFCSAFLCVRALSLSSLCLFVFVSLSPLSLSLSLCLSVSLSVSVSLAGSWILRRWWTHTGVAWTRCARLWTRAGLRLRITRVGHLACGKQVQNAPSATDRPSQPLHLQATFRPRASSSVSQMRSLPCSFALLPPTGSFYIRLLTKLCASQVDRPEAD
jgi:hypothetical protein